MLLQLNDFSKHAEGKQAARQSVSRVNLPQTIAIDHRDPNKQNKISTPSHKCRLYQFREGFVKWIEYNGRLHKAGKCVVYIDILDDMPNFGLVTSIFMREEAVFLCYKKISTIGFDEHRQAYVVDPSDINVENHFVNVNHLCDTTPLKLRKIMAAFAQLLYSFVSTTKRIGCN